MTTPSNVLQVSLLVFSDGISVATQPECESKIIVRVALVEFPEGSLACAHGLYMISLNQGKVTENTSGGEGCARLVGAAGIMNCEL